MEAMRDRAHELLTDAMVMLRDIEKARQLPAYAEVYKQYIALGREIEAYLKEAKHEDNEQG
jgi:hypothetical protein